MQACLRSNKIFIETTSKKGCKNEDNGNPIQCEAKRNGRTEARYGHHDSCIKQF